MAAGHEPTAPYVSHGYDVAFLMALAIEKAGGRGPGQDLRRAPRGGQRSGDGDSAG